MKNPLQKNLSLQTPSSKNVIGKKMDPEIEANEAERASEASWGEAERSEDETPTTSDEEFIVSDSEMAEAEQEECEEDEIELLFESFVNLQEEHKILKKELAKQSCLLWEIRRELKEN